MSMGFMGMNRGSHLACIEQLDNGFLVEWAAVGQRGPVTRRRHVARLAEVEALLVQAVKDRGDLLEWKVAHPPRLGWPGDGGTLGDQVIEEF